MSLRAQGLTREDFLQAVGPLPQLYLRDSIAQARTTAATATHQPLEQWISCLKALNLALQGSPFELEISSRPGREQV